MVLRTLIVQIASLGMSYFKENVWNHVQKEHISRIRFAKYVDMGVQSVKLPYCNKTFI